MPGSLTTPGRTTARDSAAVRVAFQFGNTVGTREKRLSRLDGQPARSPTDASPCSGTRRTARGRGDSLGLHRKGLSPPTPCRSPGALPTREKIDVPSFPVVMAGTRPGTRPAMTNRSESRRRGGLVLPAVMDELMPAASSHNPCACIVTVETYPVGFSHSTASPAVVERDRAFARHRQRRLAVDRVGMASSASR
jgi:hypothetical protein